MDRTHPSRREFLRIAGLTAAAAGLAACGSRGSGGARPSPGGRFVEPDELRSRNGRLDARLVAEGRTVRTGGVERYAYTYNGSTPGPTWRVRPGDIVTITLVNRLDAPTNLHTHGLHVSPEGRSDDVFVEVAPGASHRYRYEIPADHPSGLFWYHPHHHGMVAEQVFGGLAGAIVVEDGLDDTAPLRDTVERLLVIADPPLTSSVSGFGASPMERMQGREGDLVLVNGRLRPVVDATSGALERWRLLNASPSRYQRIRVDGHALHVIGTDAGRIPRPVTRDEVVLAPGERVEVLVAPGAAGEYRVRSEAYDRGSMMGGSMMGGGTGGSGSVTSSGVTLAVLAVRGDGPAAAVPGRLAVAEAADGAVTHRRTLTLGMAMGGGGGGMMGGGGGGIERLTIDGRTFDAARTDQRARLGAVEEWTVENPTAMDHPFHLHVWPFVVLDGGGAPVIPGGRKDTVNVPAGSAVRFRVAYTDFGGRTVYHCHILDHEDLGMMGVIEVSGSGQTGTL